MKKQTINLLKKVVLLIIVVLLAFTPTIATAVSYSNSTTTKDYSSILSIITQRYKDTKDYKEYLGTVDSFVDEMDTKISTDEAKIQIIDKTTELQKNYSNSTVIPKLSNQIINTAITSKAETTPDLLTEVVNKVKGLLGNTNLAIQSLKPDVTVNDMVATTAGKLCGEEYKVNLSGKIYYAEINNNKQPTSNKWVVLLHGVNMNGQAMADAVGQMYIDKGYNILAIDSRGQGDSDGKVGMGYLESLDVWDWLTYLNSKYSCEKIIIHGVSLGGATTIFTSGLTIDGKTLKEDQHVIGLVEDCGYTSLIGIIKGLLGGSSDSEETVKESDAKLAESILGIDAESGFSSQLSGQSLVDSLIKTVLIKAANVGLTEENFDTYQDGLKSLKNCELPILVIHGKSDSMVPFENSEIVYQTAMENSKIPYVQRFVAEGEQHAFIVIGSKQNVYEGHVKNFIEKAESISNGEKVNKVSDYQEEEEQKASLITSLIKALKLIKNMLG